MNSIFKGRSCLTPREVKQYLGDELSDEQRYDVENHLLDCELCSAAVGGYAQTQAFESSEKDIAQIQSAVSASAQRPLLQYRPWVNRAAAAAVILLLLYAGFRYWGATQAEQLFAAYFEPAPNTYITYRSAEEANTALPEELEQALDYYDAEDFAPSIPHFDHYLGNHPDDGLARLLSANAYLRAGQAERAEEYLLQLEAEEEALEEQVQWYLALAYLRQGKTGAARKKLEHIQADMASPFRERAEEVLERLE